MRTQRAAAGRSKLTLRHILETFVSHDCEWVYVRLQALPVVGEKKVAGWGSGGYRLDTAA